jgi:hypothetical protein
VEATSFGGGVPLVLTPAVEATGPRVTVDPPVPGSFYLDANLDLWLCTSTGPPAAWTRLLREDSTAGRVIPIAPMRVLDTRAPGGRPAGAPAVPGQIQGPLGSLQTVTLDLAGIAPLPTNARGVVGNLTVVTPNNGGYLVARPSGSQTNTSALNFTNGAIVANAFTCALGPDGLSVFGLGPTTYHLVIDLTAYVT